MALPQTLDLTRVSVLAEIIIRGGDLHDPSANVRQILQSNYRVLSPRYGVYGLSILLNAMTQQSASYALLAQRNQLLNKKLSLSVVGVVTTQLRRSGYGIVIYVTPSHDLPDHHTLAVFDVGPTDEQGRPLGSAYHELPDAAADAIIRAFTQVVDNPYPKPRP